MAEAARRPAALAGLLAVLIAPAAAGVDAQRAAELRHLLRQDCGACHGLTRKGGLGPALLPERLRGRSDAELARIILDGVPGTPMPPWRGLISEEDARWLVGALRRAPGAEED